MSIDWRDDVWMVPGATAAQNRLGHQGGVSGIDEAFNSLDIFPYQTAKEYLAPQLKYLRGKYGIEEAEAEALYVILLGFGMVCVEAERERVRDELAPPPPASLEPSPDEIAEHEATTADTGVPF